MKIFFLTFIVLPLLAKAQNYTVAECLDGDCTKQQITQVVVEKVTKVRDRDVKKGLCIRSKIDGEESRVERKDDTFAVLIKHNKDDKTLTLNELMVINDKYHKILKNSLPVPCDQTIFGDEEYINACKNGSNKWPRVSFCLDHKTLRKQKMYQN